MRPFTLLTAMTVAASHAPAALALATDQPQSETLTKAIARRDLDLVANVPETRLQRRSLETGVCLMLLGSCMMLTSAACKNAIHAAGAPVRAQLRDAEPARGVSMPSFAHGPALKCRIVDIVDDIAIMSEYRGRELQESGHWYLMWQHFSDLRKAIAQGPPTMSETQEVSPAEKKRWQASMLAQIQKLSTLIQKHGRRRMLADSTEARARATDTARDEINKELRLLHATLNEYAPEPGQPHPSLIPAAGSHGLSNHQEMV